MSGPPLLYEINTRCWLRELSVRLGRPVRLGDVPDEEIAGWRGRGFTHVWLMGVWAGGPLARALALGESHQRLAYSEALPDWTEADVGSSPYSVAGYRVGEELGGERGLTEFRRKLHRAGLALILDFVPNHLGLDHSWLHDRPELFVPAPPHVPGGFPQRTVRGLQWLAHGRDPYFPPWTDTAQIEYRNPDARAAMTELLSEVATRCDGVRCDMAMLVLNEVFAKTWHKFPSSHEMPSGEFWTEAIGATRRAHSDFLFLAEAYWGLEPRLQALGFDYTYDKTLLDKLVAHDASGTQQHLLEMPRAVLSASAHFLENHDEARIAARLSLPEHRAAALLMLALPGLRLLHEGQLSGALHRTPVQLLRRQVEPENLEIGTMYERLLSTLPRTAIGQGQAELVKPRPAGPINATYKNVVLLRWQAQPAKFDLVAVNLAPHASQCRVPLETPDGDGLGWSATDLLGTDRFKAPGAELANPGLLLDLPAHAARVLQFSRATSPRA